MKITPTNNINFGTISKITLNTVENSREYDAIVSVGMSDNNQIRVIQQHHMTPHIAGFIKDYLDKDKTISFTWLKNHADCIDCPLPKYMKDGTSDMYLITDEDVAELEKFEQKELKKRKRNIMFKAPFEHIKSIYTKTPDSDRVIQYCNKFDKQAQKSFDKFLKNKKILPLNITWEE